MNTVDFKYLENITSIEFVEHIKKEVNEGAKIVSIRTSECYAYVDLFNGCFEHYTFDPDTKKYTTSYLSLTDVKLYANFIEKEHLMRP